MGLNFFNVKFFKIYFLKKKSNVCYSILDCNEMASENS